jgi:general secretion pathway protein F
MPLFHYKALSSEGKKIKGTIDADNLQDAKQKLIRRQIAVLEIAALGPKETQVVLSRQEVLNFTRELSRLLHAGLPLFEALLALEEKYRGQKPHRLCLDLADRVRGGNSFSVSLSAHPKCFDLLYCSMVANSERTGRLQLALGELAHLMSRQEQVREKLTAALLYPALLLSFCIVVLNALIFYVVPSLKELFEGRDLHPLTRIVFAISDGANHSKGALFVFFALIIALLLGSLFIPSWKKRLFSLTLSLPFLKNIAIKVSLSRFFRATATLLEGGLPLIEAFKQARVLMKHPPLEKVLATAEVRIAQGESIQATFQNQPLIPPLVPRMIGIAEQGGKLPFMMEQIASIYEDDLEKTLTHFSAVAQPVLLLILGVIIGLILLSVLLPLTDVSSFATG